MSLEPSTEAKEAIRQARETHGPLGTCCCALCALLVDLAAVTAERDRLREACETARIRFGQAARCFSAGTLDVIDARVANRSGQEKCAEGIAILDAALGRLALEEKP